MPDFPQSLVATQATLNEDDRLDQVAKATEMLALVHQLRSSFAERDKLYQVIDRVVYLENEVDIPDAFKKTAINVRSPLPVHIVNTITAALSINPALVHYKPTKFGNEADDNQAVREEYFKASWRRQEADAKRRLLRLVTHALVTKGEGILKTVERKNKAWANYGKQSRELRKSLDAGVKDEESQYYGWDDDALDKVYDAQTEEYKRAAPLPYETTDVPPETFYYLKGECGLTYACEVKKIPYYSGLDRFGATINANREVVPLGTVGSRMGLARPDWARAMGQEQYLNLVEIWDLENVHYILSGPGDVGDATSQWRGLAVKSIKHRYGDRKLGSLRGPYFHAFGTTTSSRDIEKQGLSVLFGYLHLFPLLDSLLTIQSQAAYTFGFPAYKRTTPPALGVGKAPFGVDAMQRDSNRQEIIPGHIFPYDIAALDQPRGGIDLDKTIAMVRSMLELALPATAQGVVQGDQSGYAINQAAYLARLGWNPLIDNLEIMLAERVGFESWLIEHSIKETVYVSGRVPKERIGRSKKRRYQDGWIGLGPKDLEGDHDNYTVKLQPETPSNITLEIRKHKDLLEMKLETPDQAIEGVGNNPVEVKRGWLLWEIENDPEIRGMMKRAVFNRLGAIDQQALASVGGPSAGSTVAPPQPGEGGVLPIPVPGGGALAVEMPVESAAPTPQNEALIGITGTPGTPPGAPGGERNLPSRHQPLPGQAG